MRRLIITEEEKKNILGLHRIFEQSVQINTSVAPKTWQTMTPDERKTKRLELGPELYQVYRDSVSKVVQDKKSWNFEKYAIINKFYEIIDDKTFLKGVQDESKDTNEYKDFVYRELPDKSGKMLKVKINLKDYRKHQKKCEKRKDVALDGLNNMNDKKNSNTVDGPSFLDKINIFKEIPGCIFTDEDKSGVKK